MDQASFRESSSETAPSQAVVEKEIPPMETKGFSDSWYSLSEMRFPQYGPVTYGSVRHKATVPRVRQ